MFKFLIEQWIQGFCIFGMNATLDFTSGNVRTDLGGLVCVVNIADFSKTNVEATDVVQVAKVRTGYTLIDSYSIVLTPEGAACTATLGDTTSAAAIDASVNFNAAAGTCTRTTVGTDNYAVGRHYTSNDTIDYVMGHDTDAAVIKTVLLFAVHLSTSQKA